MKKLTRRNFLEMACASAAGAFLPPLTSCAPLPQARNRFPQGIASGDPSPYSVILWTRVDPEHPGKAETVTYEVALDERFLQVVVRGDAKAFPDYDHTLRIRVEGLRPFT